MKDLGINIADKMLLSAAWPTMKLAIQAPNTSLQRWRRTTRCRFWNEFCSSVNDVALKFTHNPSFILEDSLRENKIGCFCSLLILTDARDGPVNASQLFPQFVFSRCGVDEKDEMIPVADVGLNPDPRIEIIDAKVANPVMEMEITAPAAGGERNAHSSMGTDKFLDSDGLHFDEQKETQLL